jgi:hypothetical protein
MPNESFMADVRDRVAAFDAEPRLLSNSVERFLNVDRRFVGDYTLEHPLIRPVADVVTAHGITIIDFATANRMGARLEAASRGATSPDGMSIAMRDFDRYESAEEYAHILAHELTHAAGRQQDGGVPNMLYGVLPWVRRVEEATAEVGAILMFERLALPMSERWYQFAVDYVANTLVGGFINILPEATQAAEARLARLFAYQAREARAA